MRSRARLPGTPNDLLETAMFLKSRVSKIVLLCSFTVDLPAPRAPFRFPSKIWRRAFVTIAPTPTPILPTGEAILL